MDIQLINEFDTVSQAWAFSRPALKEFDVDQIRELNLPVNEFQVMHLQIECTIAERELFTMSRRHVMWAQTSRVQDVLKFEYDGNYFHGHESAFMEEMRDKMKKAEANGVRQDDYRLDLPVYSLTKFNLIISVRELFFAMDDFHFMNANTTSGAAAGSFGRGYLAIKKFIHRHTDYEDISGRHENKLSEKIKGFEKTRTTFADDDFAIVNFLCNVNLRSQMVRHRNLLFVDDFFQILLGATGYKTTQATEVRMRIAGSISDIKSVVSKRSCWIAHYGIWKGIINSIEEVIKTTQADLPCYKKACPYNGDAMIRYGDDDPNPPCPIHASRMEMKLSVKNKREITDMIASDSRPAFWYGEIN